MNERIIKFPVPDWNKVISSELASMAYCICYQHNIDIYGFGPYGFDTDHASKILSKTFPNLLYLEKSNNGDISLTSVKEVRRKGLYLYGDNEELKQLNQDLIKYNLVKKKNEIKLKKGLEQEVLPSKPLLLMLLDKDGYNSAIIQHIASLGCGILICNFYTPEAGNTLILFDQNLIINFKNSTLYYDVSFVEVNSINDLKSW